MVFGIDELLVVGRCCETALAVGMGTAQAATKQQAEGNDLVATDGCYGGNLLVELWASGSMTVNHVTRALTEGTMMKNLGQGGGRG